MVSKELLTESAKIIVATGQNSIDFEQQLDSVPKITVF